MLKEERKGTVRAILKLFHQKPKNDRKDQTNYAS